MRGYRCGALGFAQDDKQYGYDCSEIKARLVKRQIKMNKEKMTNEISAPRLLLSAVTYLKAFQKIKDTDFYDPVSLLLCITIELSLKAFLRADGIPEKDLRKLGHDLNLIIERVNGRYCFSKTFIDFCKCYNEIYKKKEFEYIPAGYKEYYPHIYDILIKEIIDFLVHIYPYCYKSINVNSSEIQLISFKEELEDQ